MDCCPDIFTGIELDHYDCVHSCLENKTPINYTKYDMYPPLHLACIYNKPEILGLLLQYNPDVNCIDKDGETSTKGDTTFGELDKDENGESVYFFQVEISPI